MSEWVSKDRVSEQERQGRDKQQGSKKTNADVIRSMNDYELAHWLSTTFCYGYGEADFFVWLANSFKKVAHGTENSLGGDSGFSLSRFSKLMW